MLKAGKKKGKKNWGRIKNGLETDQEKGQWENPYYKNAC